jgi:hypothetical protein
MLQALARALAALDRVDPSDEQAVRSVIMHLYRMCGDRAFTDEFAPGFSKSPARKVLEAMREHHAVQVARRAVHDYRNSPDGIAEARARRKAASEERNAKHRARKAARDAARRKPSADDT